MSYDALAAPISVRPPVHPSQSLDRAESPSPTRWGWLEDTHREREVRLVVPLGLSGLLPRGG